MAEAADCVFCRVLAGQVPGSFVYRDDQVAAFMAVPQAGRGHALIVPVEHYTNAYDVPPTLAGPIFELALRLARTVKHTFGPDGVTLLQNSERGANQTVMHFHLHVIGRLADRSVNIHDPTGISDRPTLDQLARDLASALEREA